MSGTQSRHRLSRLCFWPLTALLFTGCYLGAFLLRLDGESTGWIVHFRGTLPFVLALKLMGVFALRMHRGVWRYAGVRDLSRTGLAVAAGSFFLILATLLLNFPDYAFSVAIIDSLLCLVVLSTTRVSIRMLREVIPRDLRGRRLLVVGAGDAGEMAVRELQRHRHGEYRPVAFVDDDPSRHSRRIHGLEVKGRIDDLDRIATAVKAKAILVAIANASKPRLREILETARATGLPVKRIPSLNEMIAGRVNIDELRDYSMDDLLRRKTITTDREPQRRFFREKTVLVTGAAGSIGSELCRQIFDSEPAEIILLDKDENALFKLEHELAAKGEGPKCTPVLASIRDDEKMEAVFRWHKPQLVFHAAAYKHVPVLEHFPEEAVRNNVQGTRTVAALAHRHGAEAFVLISTDKAVRPTSVMGATKRIAEFITGDFERRSDTRYTTIRFGNVLGSNGSVVQLFRRQIDEGGPVTVTHPEIKRYFMTIPEAVDLVLFAATMGDGGTYILDMGEQVRVLDMARHLIRLSGLEPERDIQIEFTGLRPGEKMYEELWTDEELPRSTFHPSILAAPRPSMDHQRLEAALAELVQRAHRMDRRGIMESIRHLVPEYTGEPVCLLHPQAEEASELAAEAGLSTVMMS